MRLELLLPPIAGGIIGWVTNYVAIKLLFRPHIPFSILGYQVQGVIPKRRKEIARSMAKAIEKDLLSSGDFAKALHERSIRAWYLHLWQTLDTEASDRQHRAVLNAIEARDPQGAAAAMRQHLAALRDKVAQLHQHAPKRVPVPRSR